jgi:hypothetical protein
MAGGVSGDLVNRSKSKRGQEEKCKRQISGIEVDILELQIPSQRLEIVKRGLSECKVILENLGWEFLDMILDFLTCV